MLRAILVMVSAGLAGVPCAAQIHPAASAFVCRVGGSGHLFHGPSGSLAAACSERTRLFLSGSWAIPSKGEGGSYLTGGPSFLPVGDTTWREVTYSTRRGYLDLGIGMWIALGADRRVRTRAHAFLTGELCAAVQRMRQMSTSTNLTTGERSEFDHAVDHWFTGIRLGVGYRIPLGKGAIEVSGSGFCLGMETLPWAMDANTELIAAALELPTFRVGYEWVIGEQ